MRRMMIDFSPKLKTIWDKWDLRGFIFLSFLLQIFLILFAPLRKRTSRNRIIIPLWSAYLLADWVANFSIGLITRQGKSDGPSSKNGGGENAMEEDLFAFWAPFLLVHLGGPDTITAFALEDNEFWLRHLIGLVVQCLATLYVFVQSLPQNQLWIPTMLMFMNGTIKYAERTCAFFLASADRFKWSMHTNVDSSIKYMELMEEHLLEEDPELAATTMPDRSDNSSKKAKKENLTELEVLQYAYCFFNTFKGLVVDLIFSRRTRNQSRDFFLNRSAKDAFELVEVELNFLYEVLFTKLPLVYGQFGGISKIISLATVCSAIGLFIFENKSNFSSLDVMITYGLLFSALSLDIAALLMLIFSEKSIIFLSKFSVLGKRSLWIRILYALNIRKMQGMVRKKTSEPQIHSWLSQFITRRWSETIPTFNLIDYSLHPYSRFERLIYEKLGLGDFVGYHKYVKVKMFTVTLRDFIFDELKSKSKLVDDIDIAMEISSSRGDWVLCDADGWRRLIPYTLDGDYGQRILLWHIATNLCYNKELSNKLKSEGHVKTKNIHREIAKRLSDYMLYLLIMKPTMMSAITSTVQIQFSDVCVDATSIFKSGKINEAKEEVRKESSHTSGEDVEVDWDQFNACMKIFAIPEDVWLRNVKGDLKKSLLLYSFILAKEVMKIEEEDTSLDKWLIISKVWVELLCYGASHSQAKVQAAQVSKGGELITIVWLLMAHFGLGDQFQINEHQKKARFVVD